MSQNKNNIKYNKLDTFLSSAKEDDIPSVVLIYGEPYLIHQTFKTLSSFLLGTENNQFALETLEGGSVSMGDIIEQVSTFSFFVSKKIVVVKNIPLFQAQQLQAQQFQAEQFQAKQKQGSSPDISFSPADLDHLMDFIEKGIPANHFLILTTPHIDKRKKI